jgi:hypothetical protein
VANKVCALFGRAEVRDYVDVDAILASGRYTKDDLLALAGAHDAGFDPLWRIVDLSTGRRGAAESGGDVRGGGVRLILF